MYPRVHTRTSTPCVGDNWRLLWVWLGLVVLMVVRAATILGALLAGAGPFEKIGPLLEGKRAKQE